MEKNKKTLIKNFLTIFLMILGIGFLLISAWYTPPVQNNRYIRAYKIEKDAKKYPAGSEQRSRAAAMAEAIRSGQDNYTYSPGSNPTSLPGIK